MAVFKVDTGANVIEGCAWKVEDRGTHAGSMLMPRTHTATAFVALLLLGGCSNAPSGDHSFRIFQEEGVSVAENTGGPRFSGDLFIYEPLTTLDQDPESPETLVYGARKFAWDAKGFFVDPDGRYYVRDRGNVRIAVFEASGRYKGSIGRVGSGPGDFGESFELIAVADGIIEVYDPGPRRFTRFRPDGVVADITNAPIPGFRLRYDREADTFTDIRSSVDLGSEFISSDIGFITVDGSGEEIRSGSTDSVPERYAYPWNTRTGVAWAAIPFVIPPLGAHAPDGSVVLAQNDEPVLWWYGPDRMQATKVVLDIAATPIEQRDVNAYFEELARSSKSDDAVEELRIERMRQSLQVPTHRSLWTSMMIDDRGYIWLQVNESAVEREAGGGGYLHHVLSPAGEFLGSTRTPVEGRVMRGLLLGVSVNDQGPVEYAVWKVTPISKEIGYRQED